MCVPACKIVDGREVEPAVVGDDAGVFVPFGQLFVVGEGCRVGGVILDNQHLKVFVGGFGVQAVQAFFQVVDVVLVGDQDRHQRLRLVDLPAYMAGAGEFARFHRAAASGCRQMIRHRLLRRRHHIGLGVRAAAGGRRVYPPVIQHLRDVQGLGGGVAALHFVDDTQK